MQHQHHSLWQFALNPDRKTLASCGQDGTIKIWRTA
ncbi:hypothetical protein [Nostoc sp. NIES-3756]